MKSIVILLLTCSGTLGMCQGIGTQYHLIPFTDVTKTPYDTFRVKAMVSEIYVCPPCPKGMTCKPCLGDHLMVTSKSSSEPVHVFTKTPTDFKKGNSYVFLVVLQNKAHPEFGTTLISSELLEK